MLYRLGAEDLCRPEIMEAARNNRVILLADTNGAEDKKLVKLALSHITKCWKYVRPGIDLNLIRLYVNGVLDSEPERFRASMVHERRYPRYLSWMVGALLEHKVFMCSTNELAKCLSNNFKQDWPTIERYLYEGRHNMTLKEIFLGIDTKFTKVQTDLCSVNQ